MACRQLRVGVWGPNSEAGTRTGLSVAPLLVPVWRAAIENCHGVRPQQRPQVVRADTSDARVLLMTAKGETVGGGGRRATDCGLGERRPRGWESTPPEGRLSLFFCLLVGCRLQAIHDQPAAQREVRRMDGPPAPKASRNPGGTAVGSSNLICLHRASIGQ